MMTLADTTTMLDETTEKLSGDLTQLTPQEGTQLIDQWIDPLREGENTKPMAEKLATIKKLLESGKTDSKEMADATGELADMLTELSPQMGSEGEIPSLLEGLASALRGVGGTSKAD